MNENTVFTFIHVILWTRFSLFHALPDPLPFPQGEGPDGTMYKTAYKCEGDSIKIDCDFQETIKVIRANYGRFSIAICNNHGYTDWSVNCMSPKTTIVFQNKCDGQKMCTMPVNSDIFGDPCPGTPKYVEVHYACTPKFRTTTLRPLPPWFIESGASNLWNPNYKDSTQYIHVPTASHSIGEVFLTTIVDKDRRPILVTQPTSLRIPITTPTTTSTSMSKMTTISLSTTTITTTTKVTSTSLIKESSDDIFEILVENNSSIENLSQYCPETIARNIKWPWTLEGETSILPCPDTSTGLARWFCTSDANKIGWSGIQPDMSDCKSQGMSDLEVRVREEEPENILVALLVDLSSLELYGGDLDAAVTILRTISNRIRYLLQMSNNSFYDKESYLQEIFQNVIRSAENLMKQPVVWKDLHLNRQIKIASSLLATLEETAIALASVINNSEDLEEISSTMTVVISILNDETRNEGLFFPVKHINYEFEDNYRINNKIHLSRNLLHQNSNGLIKAVFFIYKDFHLLLSQGEQRLQKSLSSDKLVLNSRVMSATLINALPRQVISHSFSGVTIELHHLLPNLTNPVCVIWDFEVNLWSNNHCMVLESDEEKTVCNCNQLGHFGLLMKHLDTVTSAGSSGVKEYLPSQMTIQTLEIATYVAVALSLVFIIIILLKYRLQISKLMSKYSCLPGEHRKEINGCPKSQSFFSGLQIRRENNVACHGIKETYKTTLSNSKISQYVFTNSQDQTHYHGSEIPKRTVSESYDTSDPLSTTRHLRDVVYMSPQLSQLTNTLKAKKKNCNSEHLCYQNTSSRQNDNTMLPEAEVVFRAVSPHGHVYWEIDSKKRHLEEECDSSSSRVQSDMSRQSSSRFSDNHPLILSDSSLSSSPGLIVNPFAELAMISNEQSNISYVHNSSKHRPDFRFCSLRQPENQCNKSSSATLYRRGIHEVQRQVQIRDLRSIPVSIKSNDYILTKIQNHIGRNSPITSAVNQRKV